MVQRCVHIWMPAYIKRTADNWRNRILPTFSNVSGSAMERMAAKIMSSIFVVLPPANRCVSVQNETPSDKCRRLYRHELLFMPPCCPPQVVLKYGCLLIGDVVVLGNPRKWTLSAPPTPRDCEESVSWYCHGDDKYSFSLKPSFGATLSMPQSGILHPQTVITRYCSACEYAAR